MFRSHFILSGAGRNYHSPSKREEDGSYGTSLHKEGSFISSPSGDQTFPPSPLGFVSSP